MQLNSLNLKTYIRFLFSYLLFILLLLLIFSYAYFSTIDRIKQDKISETLTRMEQGRDAIDEHFLRTFKLLDNLTKQSDVMILESLKTPFESKDYYTLLKAQKLIATTELLGDVIVDCMLLYNSADTSFMLSPKYIARDFKEHYDKDLLNFGELNYSSFMDLMSEKANLQYNIHSFIGVSPVYTNNSEKREVMTFVKQLHTPNSNSNTLGLIFLDASKIRELILPFGSEAGSFLCVTDRNMDILMKSNYDHSPLPVLTESSGVFKRDHATLICVSSYKTGLTYYVSVPENWIKRQMVYFSTLYGFLIVILILLGLVMSLLLAYYNIKPVKRLIDTMGMKSFAGEAGNIFDFLRQSFDTVYSNNKLLSDKLNAWEPIIKSALLEHLLKGGIINPSALEIIPGLYDTFPKLFRVTVLGISSYADHYPFTFSEKNIDIVYNHFRKHFGNILVHPIDEKTTAIIISTESFGDSDPNKGMELLDQKLTEINNDLNTDPYKIFSIGVGGQYSCITDVSLSYFEAKKALSASKMWRTSHIIWHDKINVRSIGYEFPYEYIEKLKNYLVSGDAESASLLLDRFVALNFRQDREPGNDLYMQFFYEIRGILLRISADLPVEQVLQELPEHNTMDTLEDTVCTYKELFVKIAEISKNQKNMVSSRLLQSILAYIKTNYRNPIISLKSISREFSMSDKYISLFFKEKTGCNFSDYVENLRLRDAIDLMKDTEIPINEIQERIGYTSNNTFYKAFKRKYGISPSGWISLYRTKC